MLIALEAGQDLVKGGNTNADKIEERIRDIQEKWTNLIELANYRKKRLQDSLAFQQVYLLNIFVSMYLQIFYEFFFNYIHGLFLFFVFKFCLFAINILHFFQFCADADDINTWMVDTLQRVSSEEVGHDEASALALVKKHKVLYSTILLLYFSLYISLKLMFTFVCAEFLEFLVCLNAGANRRNDTLQREY